MKRKAKKLTLRKLVNSIKNIMKKKAGLKYLPVHMLRIPAVPATSKK